MSNLLLWGLGIAGAEADRITSVGDTRVTTSGETRITLVATAGGAAYLQTANVTSDGGTPFPFRWISNPWQPTGQNNQGISQGGEQTFQWAYLAVSWSMSATIVISATVDGDDGELILPDGSVLSNVRSTFTLDQQSGSLQRLSQVLAVPLVRRLIRNEAEVARWFLRGERLQITVESTGPLGVGELQLDGVEVECANVRKANYPGDVNASGM